MLQVLEGERSGPAHTQMIHPGQLHYIGRSLFQQGQIFFLTDFEVDQFLHQNNSD